jgi:NAD(P)-dependent dehydrogenase (short-subunit alcohol dehydrogenase family)
MQRLVDETVARFGRLDAAVNNAGVDGEMTPFADITPQCCGQKGFPLNAPYVASKHAIIGMTKAAALEAALYGVRVNAVAPGPVQAAMLDRVTGGDAEAEALSWQPSPKAAPESRKRSPTRSSLSPLTRPACA